jgi:tRNA-binding protein
MYRLFYNYDVSGDVLFILIDPEKKPTRTEKKNNVAAIYAGEELIGINLFDFSKSVKLKSNGVIFTPDNALMDVVNLLLAEAGLAKLPYCTDSGYKVAKITHLEEHPIDEKAQIVTLDLGAKSLTTVSWYPNLEVGKLVVVALDGTILYDGSVFHSFVSRNIPNECSLCSAKELRIKEAGEGAFSTKDYLPGEDFFLGGAH